MPTRLFRTFILRRLAQERLRTATTVVGVALGIAVVIAIQLTNASSVQGFETALETVAGKTSIEVRGAGGFVPEDQLRGIGWLREFGVVSPVVEGDVAVLLDDERTEAMRLLGVDILRDQPFRDYQLLDVGGGTDVATTQQFLTLLTDERSAVITEKFARRHGLKVGDGLRIMAGDRVLSFIVRGLLRDQGPARVLDGNFVLMDIAAAQLALDKIGRVDRLDVRVERQEDIAPALEAVGRQLPAGLTAERPARRGEQVERMLAAFHLNLTALSWVALIVGLFLVYNTVTISVIARRQEVGTLRALGVSRQQVLWLFLGEALVLATAGVALGLVLARVLADGAVALTASTVSTLYVKTAAVPPHLTSWHVGLATVIGLPLSLLAATVPALEASRVPPTAAMRGADQLETRYRLQPRFLLWPGLTLLAAVGLAQLGPIGGMPLFGYAASFATIAGASLLVPATLYGVARLTRPWLRRLLGVEGLLAHANLASAIPRLSISVAALAVSLSMMVAIAVMIGSFRDTVNYWIGQTLQADLFLSPGVRPTPSSIQTISKDVIALVQSHPDVVAADVFRNLESSYRGRLIVLGSGNYTVVLRHGSLVFKAPGNARDALMASVGTDNVAVSEPFANRFGHQVGDTITLDTRHGPHQFRIAVIFYDYSNDRGSVVLDRTTFERHYGDIPATGLTAYVREGVDPEAVRTSILGQLGDSRRIFLYTNRLLRAEVLRIFDATFAITYALEVIAIVVAMLGVAGTLLTLVLERRRELSLLRLVGAGRGQVQRMVVVEAGLIGAVSQVLGLTVGFLLSLILIYVINVQSFGWTIQFHMPGMFLLQATLAVIVGTALSGLYPARRAADLVGVREE